MQLISKLIIMLGKPFSNPQTMEDQPEGETNSTRTRVNEIPSVSRETNQAIVFSIRAPRVPAGKIYKSLSWRFISRIETG